MSKIVKQHKTTEQQPTESGWYDTDKGNLYWFNDKSIWSCRDEYVSDEWPALWYEETEISEKVINLANRIHNLEGGALLI